MPGLISQKNLKLTILVTVFFSMCICTETQAATFGQNKVQYTHFQWKYLTTEHFDIYYTQGGREAADFAAEVAEETYARLSRLFRFSLEEDSPIKIVTYNSHNDFEQTNVSSGPPDESTGGFTEFLKTRVVVPFEGEHEKFRHVIEHELTHAMMLFKLYGQGFGAVMAGISQARLPLWFIEGLAEYISRGGLDSETEMFLRDAVVNDRLPDVYELNSYGYLGVYKCGQSILYWIALRYGENKIGELLHKLKALRDFDRSLKASIGIDQKELSKRWRRFLKERYWTQAVNMSPPDEGTQRLTDHIKEYCYVNNSPALSPNGEWIAFLSDRSDYFDVYLMSTIDAKIRKRLIHGQRSGKFEELHWLRPGFSWAPDGKRIALCAKAGKQDALYLIEVPDGKITGRYQFNSDALFSPSWSPDGSKIALIRIKNGQSDIVVYHINDGKLDHVTFDIFDEADPSWSPDSKRLLFTSNRGNHTSNTFEVTTEELLELPYSEFDIYEIVLDTRHISRKTNDRHLERTPIWTPVENTILYVSDQSGVFNIYLRDIASGETRAITNSVTGCFQPTIAWNTRAVAFASYNDIGYDIYMLNNPFDVSDTTEVHIVPESEKILASSSDFEFSVGGVDYSQYVFDRLFQAEPKEVKEELDSAEVVIRTRTEDGKYRSRDYKVKLQPDFVYVNASYNVYQRMQGQGMILFSDVLGNHNVYLTFDFIRSTDNSNFFFMYQYLARRIYYGGGTYHYAYPFYYKGDIWRDRSWGFFLTGSYPFSKYNRLEFGSDYTSFERSRFTDDGDWKLRSRLNSVIPQIGLVHDTSIWRRTTSPSNGGRWRIDALWSPDVSVNSDNGINFYTFSADWRRYYAYKKDYAFAFRLNGATSDGRNPQRFFLGGMGNWFNPRFDNPDNGIVIDNIEDVYFASFVTPLRGVGYYNQIGTRYLLGNAEFRFPFIQHLLFGWPLPFYFRDVRGALFTDYGAAWDPDKLDGKLLPDKWTFGFGTGIRIDLGIFPIEWDVAWSPDKSSNMGPRYYFSLNTGF